MQFGVGIKFSTPSGITCSDLRFFANTCVSMHLLFGKKSYFLFFNSIFISFHISLSLSLSLSSFEQYICYHSTLWFYINVSKYLCRSSFRYEFLHEKWYNMISNTASSMIHTVQQDILMPTALDGFLTKLTDVSTTNHTFFTVTIHKEKNVLMLLMFIIWSPTIFGLSLSLSLSLYT